MRLVLAVTLGTASLLAQGRPPNGPRSVDPAWHALVHATVVARPGERIEDCTVVLRAGKIVSLGAGAPAPEGARVWDCTGLYVHVGLIDAHVPVDAKRPEPGSAQTHWNTLITPGRSALDGSGPDPRTREDLRALGFTTAAIAPKGGAARGTGAVVSLAEPDEEKDKKLAIVSSRAFHELAFETGERGEYPNSLMGAVALVRQALFDARFGVPACKPLHDELPLFFDVRDELDALRAGQVAREHERKCVIVGSGLEFKRLQALAADKNPIVVPLAFPEPPNVKTFADAEWTALKDLMTWEQAPTNPRRLAKTGLVLALTTDRLKNRADFWPNLRRAIRHGLPEERALAMLTSEAATLLGVRDRLGVIEPGALANLVVTDGPLFAEATKVRDVWVEGRRFPIHPAPMKAFTGTWQAAFAAPIARTLTLEIDDKNQVQIAVGDKKHPARECKLSERRLDFLVDGSSLGLTGVYALLASVEGDSITGMGMDPIGQRFRWSAERTGAAPPASRPSSQSVEGQEDTNVPESLPLPFGPYGHLPEPAQRTIVVQNATLWTQTAQGIVQDGTLVVQAGKIVYAGPATAAPKVDDAEVLDARGKHVTPGLVDCHSHTGIRRGVNESTQAVTAEVRIEDALDPDAIGFYRELAGGLVACNQLHGSANPIGGQNHVVKLRWGVERPEQMRFVAAPPGLKFALGENVKGSNSPDRGARYPQTRMGVEALIRDRFTAAREYTAARFVDPVGVRRDLELDALAEVLSGRRLVHCHSYRQDEIVMLCKMAEEFGFKIGTFQHVLEGYKVAPEIKRQALGASAFSDWWAYKMEAYDAIPDNGAIMHEAGICVSFNSDSDELARRLNGEAAKAVRYGGVPPHDALAFVTKNPAIQLGLAEHTGSLEAGKDGDFVIWSADPLSSYTRCLSTWIEGREYFSIARDADLRASIESEKRRLVQKLIANKPKKPNQRGQESQPDQKPGDDERAVHLRRLEEAITWRRGECGCLQDVQMEVRR